MRQAAQVYLATQVTTTSQGQILLMLYDGAIKFLTLAKEKMAAKDYAGKGNLISNALDILNELDSTLNAEKGGDLVANLHQLYFYCNKRLFTANAKLDPAPIDEVIKILGGLRSAYAQIVDTPEAIAAAEQAAQAQRIGVQQARTPGAVPVAPAAGTASTAASSARGRSAYAQGGGAAGSAGVTTQEEEVLPQAVPQAVLEAAVDTPKGLPTASVAAEEPAAPLPELPELDSAPPSMLGSSKRLAASNMYRKFAS